MTPCSAERMAYLLWFSSRMIDKPSSIIVELQELLRLLTPCVVEWMDSGVLFGILLAQYNSGTG